MNHKVNRTDGFTMIELLLAMAFISALLLAIALTVVQIANIYNRGIILKEVNATSRSLNDELDSAMRASSTFSTDPAAKRYVTNAWGGRMCLGQYSYIWNYVKALNNVDANRNQYSGPNPSGNIVRDNNGTRYEISFVKAPDAGGAYCIPDVNGKYPNINPTGAVELLRTGDHSLGLHNFSVVSNASSKDALSAQQLFKISYTLGTSNLSAMDANQTTCLPPSDPNSDFNYCSVQQFTLVLRVVSGVN